MFNNRNRKLQPRNASYFEIFAPAAGPITMISCIFPNKKR